MRSFFDPRVVCGRELRPNNQWIPLNLKSTFTVCLSRPILPQPLKCTGRIFFFCWHWSSPDCNVTCQLVAITFFPLFKGVQVHHFFKWEMNYIFRLGTCLSICLLFLLKLKDKKSVPSLKVSSAFFFCVFRVVVIVISLFWGHRHRAGQVGGGQV